MHLAPVLRAAAALALAGACLAAAAVGRAHVHGVASLSVSVEGSELRVLLDAPLDVLVGFERAPRTDAERHALQRARRQLAAFGLLRPNAEAECSQQPAAAPEGGAVRSGQGHADIEHELVFRCARPGQLHSVDVGLFDAFARLQRIDAVVVTAAGQSRRSLQRPQRSLRLAK